MNEEDNNTTNKGARTGLFRPKLSFYHPNAKGTGCALSLELHPAHDQTDGSIMAQFANQKTIGNRNAANPTYSRFDWENSICVKLDFTDLTKMLQVFRGECESLEDGKGLYHISPRATTRIVLRHVLEPVTGYSLEVYRNAGGPTEGTTARIFLAPNEASGLAVAVENSLGVICFGIPTVIPHDTTAYRREVRGMRNVTAA